MNNERKSLVPLAPLTTFKIGGLARVFIEARNDAEMEDAIKCAHELNLPVFPIGAGSNILVPDEGVEGVVIKMSPSEIIFEDEGDETILISSAGTKWEKIVDAAGERGLFGIENLAGIPGTLGGAVVQNIGAYGAELSNSFEYADCIDSSSGEHKRITRSGADFGYRTSFFKKYRKLIVIRAALRLSKNASKNIAYPDLVRASENGIPLTTPSEISRAIRAIRAEKFPYSQGEGTAGSFFKNPVIPEALANSLKEHFPDLPIFPQKGSEVKVSLAWLLDHALSLKGFSKGNVRLYENQPLVIVARNGATASEVDEFAREIAKRVLSATGITIEREVEMFGE